jgi:hypothetical protein
VAKAAGISRMSVYLTRSQREAASGAPNDPKLAEKVSGVVGV